MSDSPQYVQFSPHQNMSDNVKNTLPVLHPAEAESRTALSQQLYACASVDVHDCPAMLLTARKLALGTCTPVGVARDCFSAALNVSHTCGHLLDVAILAVSGADPVAVLRHANKSCMCCRGVRRVSTHCAAASGCGRRRQLRRLHRPRV